jgi:hypothetical protein
MSIPLPSADDETTAEPIDEKVIALSEPVPERSISKVEDGKDWVYLLAIRQRGSGVSQIIVLTHKTKFKAAELRDMVAEATKVTNEVRIPQMRERLAKAETRIPDPKAANLTWFPADAEFLEGVMIDKYEFRRLNVHEAITEIDPIVIVNA